MTTDTIETVERDTSYIQVNDSAFYKLYLSCVDGKVVIEKEIKQLGRMIKTNYKIEDNVLHMQALLNDSLMNVIERLTRQVNVVKTETVAPIIVPEKGKEWKWLIIAALVIILILVIKR